MKKVFVLFCIAFFAMVYSQQKVFILFNKNTDKIRIMEKWGASFYIALPDAQPVFFSGGSEKNYSSNKFDITLNKPRWKLKEIISSDDTYEDKYEYIVVLKKGDKYYYYYVDHIVRRIVDYLD